MSEFLRNDPSRISVMAAYRPHVKTINSVLHGIEVRCTTVLRMLGTYNNSIQTDFVKNIGLGAAAFQIP
jgi:hypothetical protein